MQILFVGCESIEGVKKATGESYGPFYKMYYLAAVQEVSSSTRTVAGIGYTPKDISISADVFRQLKTLKPLAKVELVVEADPNNLNRNVIVGVKAAAAAA